MSATSTRPRIILASGSPRRHELLQLVGIPHEVRPADIDETLHPGERPAPHTERLARTKATRIAAEEPNAVVVGADTVVVVDGDVLGKPKSEADACAMLRRLSGRTHMVFTGIAVAHATRVAAAVDEVVVTVRELTDDDIARYVATREPMDKAGAYGIQGFGATIVTRVDGDFFAVMGLSPQTLVRLLRDVGVGYRFGEGLRASPTAS